MWGAWPTEKKFLLAVALFVRYLLPLFVAAALAGAGACWFFYRVFGPAFERNFHP